MNRDQKNGRDVLNKPQKRREAAKTLGIALQTRYRKLLEASGDDEVVVATADLAQCMYENIEFIVWALKFVGGLNPPPPHELQRISKPAPLPTFQKPPEPVLVDPVADECTCPPKEAGIIGYRHMASCPKFVPA